MDINNEIINMTNEGLNSMPSRLKIDEKEYSMMMDKFNKLNKQYNENSLEGSFFVNLEHKYDILNLKDEDLKYFIDKAKYELTTLKNNMKNTREEIEKYEDFLENIKNLRKSFETTNKMYENLLSKSKFIHVDNKSLFINQFYLCEKEILISGLKVEIETKIESLKEILSGGLKSITRFKQLLLMATPEEKIRNCCNVCATNKISICMNPCGHTFCQSCADKMGICGMCRGNITSKIKLYIEETDEDDNCNYEIENFSGFNNNTFASNAVNL